MTDDRSAGGACPGVPRAQAFRVAEVIVSDLHTRRAAIQAVEHFYTDVLEYTI